MDNAREKFAQAFQELASSAIHPSAEEIASAKDATASAYIAAEVNSHLAWCKDCQTIAWEYEQFRAPNPPAEPELDAAWAKLRKTVPAPPKGGNWRPLYAIAASLAIAAVPVSSWLMNRTGTHPVSEQGTARPAPEAAPQLWANAAILDLFPEGSRTRGNATSAEPGFAGGGNTAAGVLLLHESGLRTEQAQATLRDRTGRELWNGVLVRREGVFTLVVPESVFRDRPLTLVLADDRGREAKYVLR